ncbi:hypothetical protein JMF97_30805, partial [Micromonospora fiedleri]
HAPSPAFPLGGAAFPDDHPRRPTHLLPWSLPTPPLAPDPRAVGLVGAALLTPLGLRSLSPECPGYLGGHRGGPAARDGAYHQGTVWPWLIGPYADAARRAGLPVRALFVGLEAPLSEYGPGSVPYTPPGVYTMPPPPNPRPPPTARGRSC